MFRTLTLSTVTLALLGMTPSASAYFAEDFLPPLPDASIEREANENPPVPAVTLPSDQAMISRALFTAMVVEGRHERGIISECYWDIASSVPPHFTKVFADVTTDHPYAKHLCVALRDGLIHGYGDGTFRPDQPITVAEASRILARAYALTPYADAAHYDLWSEPYVWALSGRHAIPREVEHLAQPVSVSIAREMTIRVRDGITHRPARSYHELASPQPAPRLSPAAPAAIFEMISPNGTIPVEEEDQVQEENDEEEKEEVPASKRSFWDLF